MHVTNPTTMAPDSAGKIAPSPQLVKAANEFEANFLGELLKPLREDPLFGDGSGLGGDSLGSDGPGGAMGTIGNLASEALAQAIAKQGGLGIARQVLAELGPIEAAKAEQKEVSPGPDCGACATPLTMGDAAGNAGIGDIQMLGQGTFPILQRNQDENERAEGSPRRNLGESRNDLESQKMVVAIERRRK